MPSRCWRRGKHLLLEKPGATTVPGQALIGEAAAAHPELVAMVAYHRRHDARFRELAERVAAGQIGEPFAIHLVSREDFPPSDADVAAAGGFIMDVGVHDFDTARWLLRPGSDGRLHAGARAGLPRHRRRQRLHHDRARRRGRDREPVADVALRHGHPLRDRRPRRVDPDRRAGGRRGTAILTAESQDAFPADCRGRFSAAYQEQMDAFGRACRGEATAGATLDDDRWAVATAVAARASGARGERLEVGPSWDWNFGRFGVGRNPRLQASAGLGRLLWNVPRRWEARDERFRRRP